MGTVQVLLSCMHQKDMSIIKRSNLLDIPTVVINQCETKQDNWKQDTPLLKWLNTSSRGLSVSRNLAIKYATADICVIADDDEIFEKNLVQKISSAYEQYPQADIILFNIQNFPVKFGQNTRPLKKWEILKANSIRITFRLKKIQVKSQFDPLLGSGTGNGGGEENKFLMDCWHQGLKIYFVPITIASLQERVVSLWFHGFDTEYFYKRGQSTRYIFGFWFACIYGIYFLIAKYSQYRHDISVHKAGFYLFKGLFYNLRHVKCL